MNHHHRIRLLLVVIAALNAAIASADIIDNFDDGDFTSNPTWGGDTASWTVVASSDAAAGATNSNTLRLNFGSSASGTEHLSVQPSIEWGSSQSWGFWMGRRAQSATGSNKVRIMLYATEADLESSTVKGYAIEFGDDSGGDELRLVRIANGSVAATIITSSDAVTNGITDYGFLVRVTRTSSGFWSLYTSALPTSSGAGAVASDEPNMTNTSYLQGTGSDNTIMNFADGYVGVYATHTSATAARAGFEFDNFLFSPSSDAALPVELISFTVTQQNGDVVVRWATASEVRNAGFEVLRRTQSDSGFRTIASYKTDPMLVGLGSSALGKSYAYRDAGDELASGETYFYKLVSVDIDGTRHDGSLTSITLDAVSDVVAPLSVRASPNPATNEVRIAYNAPADDALTIELYDIMGKRLRWDGDVVSYPGGSGEVRISLVGLPPGAYSIIVQSRLRKLVRRIAVVR